MEMHKFPKEKYVPKLFAIIVISYSFLCKLVTYRGKVSKIVTTLQLEATHLLIGATYARFSLWANNMPRGAIPWGSNHVPSGSKCV
jgi:hypothetical protein